MNLPLKKTVAAFGIIFSILFSFGVSGLYAQNTATSTTGDSVGDTGAADTSNCASGNTTGCTPSPGTDLNIRIENPLGVSTIQEALALFMRVVFKIAIPVIVFFFLWTGLSYILALGKPDKLKKVHEMFLWTVIGTLLILGAYTITNILVGTINTVINS